MNFKKCDRCGCFFMTEDNICGNCAPKDRFEMSKLRTYFEGETYADSINSISIETGISVKNLNRYLENKEFSKLSSKLNIGKDMNITL